MLRQRQELLPDLLRQLLEHDFFVRVADGVDDLDDLGERAPPRNGLDEFAVGGCAKVYGAGDELARVAADVEHGDVRVQAHGQGECRRAVGGGFADRAFDVLHKVRGHDVRDPQARLSLLVLRVRAHGGFAVEVLDPVQLPACQLGGVGQAAPDQVAHASVDASVYDVLALLDLGRFGERGPVVGHGEDGVGVVDGGAEAGGVVDVGGDEIEGTVAEAGEQVLRGRFGGVASHGAD